ncbi:MAG TPA: hypothetical protein VM123_15350 [archaeon]|nr:hypothetical protein [archaeon]
MRPRPEVSSRGFSLVEMMIGLTLTMLIVGAFINLFISQNKSYSRESLRQEMNLTGRIALDEVQREAMNAGTGLPGFFSSIMVSNGSSGEPDTLYFIYVPPADIVLKLESALPPSASNLKLTDDSDADSLHEYQDHLLVYDEVNFTFISVGNVNPSNGVVNFQPSVGVNTPAGLAASYDPATARIARVTVYMFVLDKTDPAHPKLVKSDCGVNPQAVAYDIEDLQITIIFEDGDTASAVNNSDADLTNDSIDLRAIKVKLVARSSRTDDSSDYADKYLRQTFSSTIAPRNIIY